jgi:hypothetical protein
MLKAESFLSVPFDYISYLIRMCDPKTRKPVTFNQTNHALIKSIIIDKMEISKTATKQLGDIRLLLEGKKQHVCGTCKSRQTQIRVKEHTCLDKRTWRTYNHLHMLEGVGYICLICFAGLERPRDLCQHYLTHSWDDVTLLGYHP